MNTKQIAKLSAIAKKDPDSIILKIINEEISYGADPNISIEDAVKNYNNRQILMNEIIAYNIQKEIENYDKNVLAIANILKNNLGKDLSDEEIFYYADRIAKGYDTFDNLVEDINEKNKKIEDVKLEIQYKKDLEAYIEAKKAGRLKEIEILKSLEENRISNFYKNLSEEDIEIIFNNYISDQQESEKFFLSGYDHYDLSYPYGKPVGTRLFSYSTENENLKVIRVVKTDENACKISPNVTYLLVNTSYNSSVDGTNKNNLEGYPKEISSAEALNLIIGNEMNDILSKLIYDKNNNGLDKKQYYE